MKWQDSPVSKTKWSQYPEEFYGSWDVLLDHSAHNFVEFVAKRGATVVYVSYAPNSLDRLTDSERKREVAHHIESFDNSLDFKSFLECKNDARLKKLVV